MNKRKYEIMLKQKQYRNVRNKNGITLIALVITIIIMVILAGVSLNATIGDNGIISKAQYSTFLSEMTDVEEALKTWQTSKILDDEDYSKRAPTNGLCTPEELQQTKRLMGEVGYYRVWNISASKPTLDLTESSESFDNKYESEFIYYPAGVQDLYYLNNEKLGINKKKKYLIDASTGIIYSVKGANLKGIQCYSLAMAKTVMEGYTDMPSFAELEISTGKNAGNVSNKYKVDENGNYILDENGNKIENPDYNPYGFKILGDSESNNVYKLYNNGELYGKGIKGLGLDTSNAEMESISSYAWTKVSVPSSIGSYKKVILGYNTIFVIDNNDNVWAWGDNDDNKLGLTAEQTKEYTGREPVKLNVKTSSGNDVKIKNVYSYVSVTFLEDINGTLYACGNNSIDVGFVGLLGTGDSDGRIDTFKEVKGLSTKSTIKKIVADRMWRNSRCFIVLYEDGSVYKLGYKSNIDNKHELTAYELISKDTLSNKIIDVAIDESFPLLIVLNNGEVMKLINSSNVQSFEKIEGINSALSIFHGRASYPYIIKNTDGDYFAYFYFYSESDIISSCNYLGFDLDKINVKSISNKEIVVNLKDLLPDSMFENNSIKELAFTGDSVSATALYIMSNGDVWGAGKTTRLGIGSDKVNSASSNSLGKAQKLIDADSTTGISSLNGVKINSFSNSIIKSCETSAYPFALCTENEAYITGQSNIMYGNSIIQSSWKKIASNVKEVCIGSDDKLGIIDNNSNAYVVMQDYRDIGVESVSNQVALGNNLKEIIVPEIKGKAKKISFMLGATFVLTNDGKLYSAGKGKFDTTWVKNAYNGRDNNADAILKYLDDNVVDMDTAGKDNIATGFIYTKSGSNAGIYFVGAADYKGLKGASNAGGGGSVTPSKVEIQDFDVSNVKKIFLQWSSTFMLNNDGNLYLGGEDVDTPAVNFSKGFYISRYTSENLNISDKIIDFVNRRSNAIFLTDKGKVYGFGAKSNLGIGSNSTIAEKNIIDLGLDDVEYICTTKEAYIVIKKDGSVYGTGSNQYGILGRWIGVDRKTPNSRYKTALDWVECPELEI